MYDQVMFWIPAIIGLVLFCFGGYQLLNMNKTTCTRCAKKLPKADAMPFLGIDMCEPCNNIAEYYNQVQ